MPAVTHVSGLGVGRARQVLGSGADGGRFEPEFGQNRFQGGSDEAQQYSKMCILNLAVRLRRGILKFDFDEFLVLSLPLVEDA